jgi:hypothetical protein
MIFWEEIERQQHIEIEHPEMSGQIDKVQGILLNADMINYEVKNRPRL